MNFIELKYNNIISMQLIKLYNISNYAFAMKYISFFV